MTDEPTCSYPGCRETEQLTEHRQADELNGGTWCWAWCPTHEAQCADRL